MVFLFLASSSCRSFVASAMATSSSATAFVRSASSSENLAMEASSWSTCACNDSTASVLSLRVCVFAASSVSHQPLWETSSLASSMSLTIKSLIIDFTLPKGSSAACAAMTERYRLPSFSDLAWRYAATRRRASASPCRAETTCANAVALFFAWRSAGRCVSAAPFTAALDRISMAFLMAFTSSARVTWFFSNSSDLKRHSARVSESVFSSSALALSVTFKSPFAAAESSIFPALAAVFTASVLLSALMSSSSCCTSIW
mmetsp:Transcript_106016/g.316623  ORF Transcript_106016/g.316623 Transcript_106016/m.316623 type:complete len:259 (+) Transcript_106016:91-867(+)